MTDTTRKLLADIVAEREAELASAFQAGTGNDVHEARIALDQARLALEEVKPDALVAWMLESTPTYTSFVIDIRTTSTSTIVTGRRAADNELRQFVFRDGKFVSTQAGEITGPQ